MTKKFVLPHQRKKGPGYGMLLVSVLVAAGAGAAGGFRFGVSAERGVADKELSQLKAARDTQEDELSTLRRQLAIAVESLQSAASAAEAAAAAQTSEVKPATAVQPARSVQPSPPSSSAVALVKPNATAVQPKPAVPVSLPKPAAPAQASQPVVAKPAIAPGVSAGASSAASASSAATVKPVSLKNPAVVGTAGDTVFLRLNDTVTERVKVGAVVPGLGKLVSIDSTGAKFENGTIPAMK